MAYCYQPPQPRFFRWKAWLKIMSSKKWKLNNCKSSTLHRDHINVTVEYIYRERERRKKHGKNALSQAHILSPHQQPLHIFLSGESTHAMLQKKPKTAPWGHHSCQSQPQVFKNYHQELWTNHMGVSKNRGTPKSSILIGVSIINHPFWGTLIFGNTHMWHPLVASWVDSCQALHHDEAPEWNLLENPLPVEKCK